MTSGETYDALVAILSPQALRAEVEHELEERGLIVTDHRPYAHLTEKGEKWLDNFRTQKAERDEKTYLLLTTAEQVDEFISDDLLNGALDWFEGEPKMGTEDFLDRLFPRHGDIYDNDGNALDLDQLDNAAARRIMSRARKLRKERDQ